MGLDVSLTRQTDNPSNEKTPQLYIREGGKFHAITKEEWDEIISSETPGVINDDYYDNLVFDAAIPNKLSSMAKAVGLYEPMWKPETIGLTKASQLVPLLSQGLERLLDNPSLRKLNSRNGWRDYELLIQVVTDYLAACKEHPDADIDASK